MTKSLDDCWSDWEAHVFGMGYGTGEAHTIPAIKSLFGAVGREDLPHAYDYKVLERECGATVAWLLINTLINADIIEYGSSPRYGWLTEAGRRLKAFIDGKTTDELIELTCRDENYVHCYPTACNCGPNGYEEGRKCGNPFWTE